MRDAGGTTPAAGGQSALLLGICGGVGMAGAVALVGTNVAGSLLVPGHDWVADTVSDLAAGRWEILQDVGLYGYAAGLLALAIGLAHFHLGGSRWGLGVLSLAALALLVTVIAARNEYGDGDTEGFAVHIYLVYALGLLFAAAPFLLAHGLARVSPATRRVTIACGVLWALGAPLFFVLPTSIDGAWERGIGLVTVVWVLALSRVLIVAARRAEERAPAPSRPAPRA